MKLLISLWARTSFAKSFFFTLLSVTWVKEVSANVSSIPFSWRLRARSALFILYKDPPLDLLLSPMLYEEFSWSRSNKLNWKNYLTCVEPNCTKSQNRLFICLSISAHPATKKHWKLRNVRVKVDNKVRLISCCSVRSNQSWATRATPPWIVQEFHLRIF